MIHGLFTLWALYTTIVSICVYSYIVHTMLTSHTIVLICALTICSVAIVFICILKIYQIYLRKKYAVR
jgi:hypothetical protein